MGNSPTYVVQHGGGGGAAARAAGRAHEQEADGEAGANRQLAHLNGVTWATPPCACNKRRSRATVSLETPICVLFLGVSAAHVTPCA